MRNFYYDEDENGNLVMKDTKSDKIIQKYGSSDIKDTWENLKEAEKRAKKIILKHYGKKK